MGGLSVSQVQRHRCHKGRCAVPSVGRIQNKALRYRPDRRLHPEPRCRRRSGCGRRHVSAGRQAVLLRSKAHRRKSSVNDVNGIYWSFFRVVVWCVSAQTTCQSGDKGFSLTGSLFAPSGRMILEPDPATRRRRADVQKPSFWEKLGFSAALFICVAVSRCCRSRVVSHVSAELAGGVERLQQETATVHCLVAAVERNAVCFSHLGVKLGGPGW